MNSTKLSARRALLTFFTYCLWLASAAVTFLLMLNMRLLLLVSLPMRMRGINPWSLGAIDKFGTVLLGAIWLIWVIVSEAYFRRLIDGRVSALNIIKVFLVEGALLALVYAGLNLL
jgi:hypothetical protein